MRKMIAIPANQSRIARVIKKKMQSRRFNVAITEDNIGIALVTGQCVPIFEKLARGCTHESECTVKAVAYRYHLCGIGDLRLPSCGAEASKAQSIIGQVSNLKHTKHIIGVVIRNVILLEYFIKLGRRTMPYAPFPKIRCPWETKLLPQLAEPLRPPGINMMIRHIAVHCESQLMKIIDALNLLRSCLGSSQCREQEGCQDSDDDDDNQ